MGRTFYLENCTLYRLHDLCHQTFHFCPLQPTRFPVDSVVAGIAKEKKLC
jgi:hypothetical protein